MCSDQRALVYKKGSVTLTNSSSIRWDSYLNYPPFRGSLSRFLNSMRCGGHKSIPSGGCCLSQQVLSGHTGRGAQLGPGHGMHQQHANCHILTLTEQKVSCDMIQLGFGTFRQDKLMFQIKLDFRTGLKPKMSYVMVSPQCSSSPAKKCCFLQLPHKCKFIGLGTQTLIYRKICEW